MSWAFTAWLVTWGITSPAGGFDFSDDVEMSGRIEDRRLYFRLGSYDLKTGRVLAPISDKLHLVHYLLT